MISGGHFELPLKKIPHDGFFGTLDMLLPDVYYFICQKFSRVPFISGSKPLWTTLIGILRNNIVFVKRN